MATARRKWMARIFEALWAVLSDPARRRLWWQRVRRGCLVGLALLLALACLACVLLGVLVGRATAAPAVAAAQGGYDAMLVVDNSNSMFDKGGVGSDPRRYRIEAAQMFINYLGVDSSPVSHRLGVVFFGGQPQLVVPLTPLSDRARRAEMAALIADPWRMDWTDPVAALALARQELLAERGDDRRPVVVLLTDGKPEWSARPTREERQAAVEALRDVGQQYADDAIRLFVVLLANEATGADAEIETVYVPLWQEMTEATQGGFFAVRRADDLVAVYHDVLVALSGARTAGAVVEAQVEDETRVEVMAIESNLERVTFVVRVGQAGAGVNVSIHRPDGRRLSPGDADVRHAAQDTTAIWTVARPDPGNWTVVIVGRGSVTVWKDYLPIPAAPTAAPTPASPPTAVPSPTPIPRLTVAGCPEVALTGEPFVLSARLAPPPPETPAVWVEGDAGDGSDPFRVRLLDDGRQGDAQAADGRHSARIEADSAGVWLIRVWAELGGERIAAWEGRVRVEDRPALEIIAPEVGQTWRTGDPESVRAVWAVDERPLDLGGPMTVTVLSPEGLVCAVVTGSVGQAVDLPAPRAAGIYTVGVAATGGLPGGPGFCERAATAVEVRRPLPWWIGLGVLVFAGAGLGGWQLYAVYKRLPRLEGRLRVLKTPYGYTGPTLIDLSLLNRRSMRVGGAGAELPLPLGGRPWATIEALADGSGMALSPCDGQAVRVNDAGLAAAHVLGDGDVIAAGEVRLRYECLHGNV